MELEIDNAVVLSFPGLRKEVVFLIVEDNKGHYTLTKYCLRHAGIDNEIIWLEDGQATLDYLTGEGHPLKTGHKNIMLLDIRMPKVDGIEVLGALKQQEYLKDISVIMLTTSEDQLIARQCYELGCDAHIIKPAGEVLLNAISRVCQRI